MCLFCVGSHVSDTVHNFRSNVGIHAHENQTKFSSLQNFDRTLPLAELYRSEFLKKKIGGQKKLEAREIEIRFTYEKSDIVCPLLAWYMLWR